MTAINPPFRAEHIGSLLRPQELLHAREGFDAGKVSAQELAAAEDKAVKAVVEMQRSIGIRGVTDGEYRRHMFFDGFHEHLEGMTEIQNPALEIFKLYVPDIAAFTATGTKPAATLICTGKLRRKDQESPYMRQFRFLASCVPPEEVKNCKITLAAPEWFHLRHQEHAIAKGAYDDEDEYYADIAKAYRAELAALYKIGCRNVQFDDPLLAYFCAVPMLEGMKKEGKDPEVLLDKYVKLYNDCLADKPNDLVVGLHLCRGNFKDGMHFSEGGYEHIATKLFNTLNADTYYLEYDTARAGTFDPLSEVPVHKTVVIGAVSSKLGSLENEEELEQRIRSAAQVMAKGSGQSVEQALGRICLSPQCGFASHSEGNSVVHKEMQDKLNLVVRVAKKIWPSDA